VLATGSSTLGASARFRDTLTGRKEEVWLTPIVWADLAAFDRVERLVELLMGQSRGIVVPQPLSERNVLVASDVQEPFTRRFGDLEVEVLSPAHVGDRLGRVGPETE
jgi:hypothetical protein